MKRAATRLPINLLLRLAEDSPARGLGFRPIPFHKIGVYKSADRASWPVEDTLRGGPITSLSTRSGSKE